MKNCVKLVAKSLLIAGLIGTASQAYWGMSFGFDVPVYSTVQSDNDYYITKALNRPHSLLGRDYWYNGKCHTIVEVSTLEPVYYSDGTINEAVQLVIEREGRHGLRTHTITLERNRFEPVYYPAPRVVHHYEPVVYHRHHRHSCGADIGLGIATGALFGGLFAAAATH